MIHGCSVNLDIQKKSRRPGSGAQCKPYETLTMISRVSPRKQDSDIVFSILFYLPGEVTHYGQVDGTVVWK